jgi:hypothetical protein
MAKKSKPSAAQSDLFGQQVFPSRIPKPTIHTGSWSYNLAMAMKRAADESGVDRHELAIRMARYLEQDSFSKATLDAYISAAKTSHDISLTRFKAFVRATGCQWLWDFVVADEGCTVLIGDEARLAEITRVQQQRDEIDAQLKKLKSTPVTIKRRQR